MRLAVSTLDVGITSKGRRRAATIVIAVALCVSFACGGSTTKSATNAAATRAAGSAASANGPVSGSVAGPTAASLQPVVASTELVVGQNRFTMGILDRSGKPIPDAQVHFKFFALAGAPGSSGQAQGTLRSESDAVFRAPNREAGLPAVETVTRPNGSKVLVQSGGDEVGVYEAIAAFDKPGDWGVEADVTGKTLDTTGVVRTPIKVLTQSVTPAIGSPAPRSRNLTVKDVTDLSIIDTSAHPTADMHTETIAEAIAAGHPTLVLFATPGYCTSRLCGPELELARKLEPKYSGKADFIHVEIYKEPPPKSVVMPAVEEWHLQSEPWFFVIDKNGNVAAKFEGPTTLDEIDQALQKVAG
jgi:hypothetical protein